MEYSYVESGEILYMSMWIVDFGLFFRWLTCAQLQRSSFPFTCFFCSLHPLFLFSQWLGTWGSVTCRDVEYIQVTHELTDGSGCIGSMLVIVA